MYLIIIEEMQMTQVNLWVSHAIYIGIRHSTDPLSYLEIVSTMIKN